MSIETELEKLATNLKNSYDKVEAKGGTLPSLKGFNYLAEAIDSIPVGGGSGDIISAINLTGNTINEGDKVWINNRIQIANSNFDGPNGYWNTTYASQTYFPVMDPTGNFIYNKNCYKVTNDNVTIIGPELNSDTCLAIYDSQNHMFFGGGSYDYPHVKADSASQFALKGFPILNSNFIATYTQPTSLEEIDLNTGNTLATYTGIPSGKSLAYLQALRIGQNLYSLAGSSGSQRGGRYIINDSAKTLTSADFTITDSSTASIYPFGLTLDNKYILGCTYSSFGYPSSSGNLRIIKCIDESNFRVLTQNEMPADLQKYYSSQSAMFLFNPANGVLSISDYKSTTYTIMIYTEENWNKLNIELPYPTDTEVWSLGAPSFSNDLSRGVFSWTPSGSQGNRTAYSKVVNLTSQNKMVCNQYNPNNINNTTLTGYATSSGAVKEEIEVSTVLPAKTTLTVNVTNIDNADITLE